jgi:hypothetical protein
MKVQGLGYDDTGSGYALYCYHSLIASDIQSDPHSNGRDCQK